MKKNQSAWASLAISLAAASAVQANSLFWQGGAGAIGSGNYYDATIFASNAIPNSTDTVYFGAGGTGTSAIDLSLGRLFVGHNTAGTSATFTTAGQGTLTVSGGTLSTTLGASGNGNAGLTVGNVQNGLLTIDGPTSAVFVNQLVLVGYGNNVTRNGTINITNGGTLTVNAGNLALGESNNNGNGVPGNVSVNGNLSVTGGGADLVIGVRAKSTFAQTGGTTTIADVTYVGRNNADGSSYSLSGGSFTTNSMLVADGTGTDLTDNVSVSITGGTFTSTGAVNIAAGAATSTSFAISGSAVVSTGAIFVGQNAGATNTSLTISGSAKVTGTSNMVVGNGTTTTNSSATIDGDAIVNLASGITLGLAADPNVVFNVGGNANITLANSGSSTVHLFVGRGTSTTTFNMTGGTLTSPNYVLIGSPAAGGNATATVNHSAGTINAGTSATSGNRGFKIADTTSTATYNLSGTGAINVANGLMIVGRSGTGTMNQTGGSVTASGGLYVGEVETSTTLGTGTYNISAGTLSAANSTADALAIGKTTTGTFRVIGDDATINVTGSMLVNMLPAADPIPARVGTLAYRLEAGDAFLSTINATGTATFAAGSVLQLDFNSLNPTQGVFTVLNAADIINGGMVTSLPAGWGYQIAAGGNGKLLKFFAGDLNSDGKINADDYALMDRAAALGLPAGSSGDLNADGAVGSADYLLMDMAYASLGGSLSPGFLALRESQFGSDYTASLLASVPEPTGLSVLALGALPVLARRRSKTR